MNRQLLRLAFAGSIIIYFGLAFFLSRSGSFQGSNSELATQLSQVFAVIYALVVLVALRVWGRGERGFLVRLAGYEAGAVFGLVLFFLSGKLFYLAAFGAVALVLVLFG